MYVLFLSLASLPLSPGCSGITARILTQCPLPGAIEISSNYFLRSTIFLSVRLLLRVFLPNVGKAHGVCG